MLRWKKAILPLAVLAAAIPATVFAESRESGSDIQSAPAIPATPPQTDAIEHGRHHKGGRFHGHGFGLGTKQDMSVHKRAYMELLVQKYAPETASQWEAAWAEQTKLVEQLKGLMPSQEEREALRKEFDAKRDELSKKLQAGEITKEEMMTQLRALKAECMGPGGKLGIARNEEEWEARRTLQKQFTDAVAAKDAAKIKTALAALLEQQKKDNENLAAKIKELQAGKTAPSAEAANT